VGYALYPTHPSYDPLYSLIWGAELANLERPSFDAYRAPTPHPLTIALGAILSPLGEAAERALLLLNIAAFVGLVAGIYRLGRVVLTPLAGWAAALLLLSRLDYAYFTARGYVDIPYLALVIWAAALAAERGRPTRIVWVLLILAGLLRPEGWPLLALCAVWAGWRAPWSRRLRLAALAAVAPVLWALVDLAVTGNPLWSLTYTAGSAADLGHDVTPAEIPFTVLKFLAQLTKPPIFLAAVVGIVLAAVMVRRRMAVPAALLAAGVATYVGITLLGLSAISRYLAVSALGLLLFAALAFTGWQLLPEGSRGRRAWALGGGAIALAGALFTALTLSPSYVDSQLSLRLDARDQLASVLAAPGVVSALRCGPVSVPNHKAIPDVRWLLDRGPESVLARSDRRTASRTGRGVAIFPAGEILTDPTYDPFQVRTDPRSIQAVPAGFRPVARTRLWAAYARC
jgi:hypothetical protein